MIFSMATNDSGVLYTYLMKMVEMFKMKLSQTLFVAPFRAEHSASHKKTTQFKVLHLKYNASGDIKQQR